METNVNYTVVGAFVVILTAAITFAIVWLSSGFSVEHYTTYLIYEQESVSGLSIDAPVEFNGVNVGSVYDIKISDNDPHLVEVLVNVEKGTPVTQGTVATLNSRGVTGITFIALKDKGTNLAPLKVKHGQHYPVIVTAPSLFLRLDTALSSLTTNISRVATAVENVLNPHNQQTLQKILDNLQKVTGNMAGNSQRFNKIVVNTERASGVLESQTLPAFYQLMNNLDTASRNIGEVSNALKQNPAILIRGSSTPILGPGEKP